MVNFNIFKNKPMKKQPIPIKTIALLLACSIFLTNCVSTTMIQSVPSNAKVYIDGQAVGTTPYAYSDTKIVGSTTMVKLEKEGYEQLNVMFSRSEQADVGAIIGGVFVLVPFLWTMKYNPVHEYELVPYMPEDKLMNIPTQENVSFSKADKLRDLKRLLDDEIITQEEFEKEKAKILVEED
jgi:hypothetical protein